MTTPTTDAVRTALRDRPSDEALARLAHSHPGRIVTVPVHDGAGAAGDRAAVFARHGVHAQLVYGGIVEISERPYGSLTYALDGVDVAVDVALAELAASGGYEEHDLGELR